MRDDSRPGFLAHALSTRVGSSLCHIFQRAHPFFLNIERPTRVPDWIVANRFPGVRKPPNAFQERSSCGGNFASRQFGDAYGPERDQIFRGLHPHFRKNPQRPHLYPPEASTSRCGKGLVMLRELAAANDGLLPRRPVVGVA